MTLTDAGNNYSGGTIVQGPGELKANAAGTLGSTSAPLTVSGGVLDLGGASHTVGAVTISGGKIQDGTLTGSAYAGQSGTETATSGRFRGADQDRHRPNYPQRRQHLHGHHHHYRRLIADQRGQQPGRRSGFGGRQPVDSQLRHHVRPPSHRQHHPERQSRHYSGRQWWKYRQPQAAYTATYPGVITGTGNFSSGGGYTSGYGTIRLSGANNYSGTTTIAAGTLQLGASGTLPYGTPLTIAADDNTRRRHS